MSTLSAVVSNYNHAALVGRAIDAMLSQSRPPDELVVIDDASTDDSVAVIEARVRGERRVRFHRNERNLGAMHTINRGFALATGDWVYSGAADDQVVAGAFETAMAFAEKHPDVGIVFGGVIGIRPDGEQIEAWSPSRWRETRRVTPAEFVADYLRVELPTHSAGGATFFRRAPLLEAGGFLPELGHWADTFASQALALRYGAGYVDAPIMKWTLFDESLSQSARRDVRGLLDVVERAAWRMRSEAHRRDFPADYVEEWVRRSRALLISQDRDRRVEQLARRLLPGARRHLRKQVQRALRPLFAPLAWRLGRYRADLSCYEGEPKRLGSASQV